MAQLFRLFSRKAPAETGRRGAAGLAPALDGYSIEVMPRTAARIEDFRTLLPQGTRVYVAHIEGTPVEDMAATVKRIADEGFAAMPHVPARLLADKAMLNDWIVRYRDAGARQALLLAGGIARPHGEFRDSMQLLETGLFDRHGFERLHVAGHPEGNRDIDPAGSDRNVMDALRWKQKFSERTDAEMAIVTQFAFELEPVIAWAGRLSAEGIALPVHLGIAGPAKLQTMIKFAISCGVGPSIRVLQRRAKDVSKLLMPYEPDEILADFLRHKAANPDSNLRKIHFFPLGGIRPTVEFARRHNGPGDGV